MKLSEKYKFIKDSTNTWNGDAAVEELFCRGKINQVIKEKLQELFNSKWNICGGEMNGEDQSKGILYINIMYKFVKKHEAGR